MFLVHILFTDVTRQYLSASVSMVTWTLRTQLQKNPQINMLHNTTGRLTKTKNQSRPAYKLSVHGDAQSRRFQVTIGTPNDVHIDVFHVKCLSMSVNSHIKTVINILFTTQCCFIISQPNIVPTVAFLLTETEFNSDMYPLYKDDLYLYLTLTPTPILCQQMGMQKEEGMKVKMATGLPTSSWIHPLDISKLLVTFPLEKYGTTCCIVTAFT
jgi:hypothetical protein